MSKPNQEALRNVTTAIAVLAAVASVPLLFTIHDVAYVYGLLHIAGCLVVAAMAWRRPWLAMLIGLAGTVTMAVLSLDRAFSLPLHGSYEHAQYDEWVRVHEPFDKVIGLATLAFFGVALVWLIARFVRAIRSPASA